MTLSYYLRRLITHSMFQAHFFKRNYSRLQLLIRLISFGSNTLSSIQQIRTVLIKQVNFKFVFKFLILVFHFVFLLLQHFILFIDQLCSLFVFLQFQFQLLDFDLSLLEFLRQMLTSFVLLSLQHQLILKNVDLIFQKSNFVFLVQIFNGTLVDSFLHFWNSLIYLRDLQMRNHSVTFSSALYKQKGFLNQSLNRNVLFVTFGMFEHF